MAVHQKAAELRVLLRRGGGLDPTDERDARALVDQSHALIDALDTEIDGIDRQQRKDASKQPRNPRTELGRLMRELREHRPDLLELTFKPAWERLCAIGDSETKRMFRAEFEPGGVLLTDGYVDAARVRATWNRERAEMKRKGGCVG